MELSQYSCGVGCLCNVPLDLIVLTGGLCTTWDVVLALEVTVGGRWVRTCGDVAVAWVHTPKSSQCCDTRLYSTSGVVSLAGLIPSAPFVCYCARQEVELCQYS